MISPTRPIVNALTVDVEEYYHAIIFQEETRRIPRASFESRVERSVDRILLLLDERGILGTFFVLGEVAAAHPAMVRRIAEKGHEVACHGYYHKLVSQQTPPEFRGDVRRAKLLLEDLTRKSVIGYRAPSFSISRIDTWVYDILLEEGFRYDSSIYPIIHDRYGHPGAPRFAYEIQRNGKGRLIELPIGTLRLLGVNIPIGGGGFFRLFPLALIQWGIQYVNAREGHPIIFYFHPWELDPNQPRPPMRWHHRFRHYVGLESEEHKLISLFRDFHFSTVRDVLGII